VLEVGDWCPFGDCGEDVGLGEVVGVGLRLGEGGYGVRR
jgi:hypothetical protein